MVVQKQTQDAQDLDPESGKLKERPNLLFGGFSMVFSMFFFLN